MIKFLVCGVLVAGVLIARTDGQQPRATGATFFEGARLITGDGGAPIDDSAFLVEGARITQVGRRGALRSPAGAALVDLRGKTVMPALVDAHSHLGYTDVRTGDTASTHYTRDNLLDHLRRYAYYGISATLSMGLDRGELPYQLRAAPADDAALFLTAGRGIAMPNAGPNAQYWRDAAYGVTTEAEARAAVRDLAGKKVDIVKIWVDDRNKSVTPLPPSLYRPIIEEAHARGLRVVAHVYYLSDAKELLRAGVDGFAHGIRDLDLDEEAMALFKARPRVFVIPNLPDTPPSIGDLAWLGETLPGSQIEALKRTAVAAPPRPRLFEVQARNLARLAVAGVPIGFGTDAGVGAPYGWSAHAEIADMVAAGMTPAQAIVAATRTSAEILRLDQLGTIAAGKSADFIVLDANPIDDIRNTRRIASVYVRGQRVDRASLSRSWTESVRRPARLDAHDVSVAGHLNLHVPEVFRVNPSVTCRASVVGRPRTLDGCSVTGTDAFLPTSRQLEGGNMRRILVLTLVFCLSSAPLLAQTLQSSIDRAGATALAAQQAVRGPIPPGWLWTGVSLLGASPLFLAVGIGYHECDYYYERGINPSNCGTDGPFWRGMGAGLAGAGATLIIIGMSKRSSNPQIIVTPGRIGVKQTIRF